MEMQKYSIWGTASLAGVGSRVRGGWTKGRITEPWDATLKD